MSRTRAIGPRLEISQPTPVEWEVTCPCCLAAEPVEMLETDAGTWASDPAERYRRCESCGTLYEVGEVAAVPAGRRPG